ncbi:hypothetical protein Dimus_039556 [Dionaea muscipula]
MVQSKHNQKSKQRKHPQAKKHGKQTDISEFRAQLDMLGLKVIQVTADGNCFFRALADQLEGNEEEHGKYRSMVVQYIIKNREMFEPFIEDEVPFDEYCLSTEKDGTWAGHMELQAASLVTHTNICIHRSMSPRWYVQNFDDQGARMIHLSYHDGEHYNSVRLKEDPGDGPARPILIKADADLTAASHHAKAAVPPSRRRSIVQTGSIKMVIAGSGCEDAEKVEQVLHQVDGDVDAAIEFLIAEQQGAQISIYIDQVLCQTDNHGNDRQCDEAKNSFPHDNLEHGSDKLEESSCVRQARDSSGSCKDDKKVPRNKMCPCGSKKKYKACCGTVADRNPSKFVIDGRVESTKTKKGKRQAKKGCSSHSPWSQSATNANSFLW